MRLTIKQAEALGDAADIICEIVGPHAQIVATSTNKTVYSAIAQLFRPYIRQSNDPTYSMVGALRDSRYKKWGISFMFWDISEGWVRALELAKTDYEVVNGFVEVVEAIREYVGDLHAEDHLDADDFEPFTKPKLDKRMAQLRPSIWRGNGKATSRIYYTLPNGNKAVCQMEIERVEDSTD